jgi:hypothetical protein
VNVYPFAKSFDSFLAVGYGEGQLVETNPVAPTSISEHASGEHHPAATIKGTWSAMAALRLIEVLNFPNR